ncbi:MAG: TIGR02281 family clan AA aspartic protease [Proteobacteria bacterium]|nr:TIGR02281 family clan AA aspartic protease [Pseudomonadota bacterium]
MEVKSNLPLILTLLYVFAFHISAYAVDDIAVMGLIKDKVILRIDGAHHVIKKNGPSIKGIKLIEIGKNRKTVTLEVDGIIKTYRLGHGTNTAASTVKLAADSTGIYKTSGKINNKQVLFIIDTGATYVSLNSNTAAELGIDFINSGKTAKAETANGLVSVYIVYLDSVEIGEIKINNVEAVIHEGDFPTMVLLGMSFLKQLKMEREGNILSLHMK